MGSGGEDAGQRGVAGAQGGVPGEEAPELGREEMEVGEEGRPGARGWGGGACHTHRPSRARHPLGPVGSEVRRRWAPKARGRAVPPTHWCRRARPPSHWGRSSGRRPPRRCRCPRCGTAGPGSRRCLREAGVSWGSAAQPPPGHGPQPLTLVAVGAREAAVTDTGKVAPRLADTVSVGATHAGGGHAAGHPGPGLQPAAIDHCQRDGRSQPAPPPHPPPRRPHPPRPSPKAPPTPRDLTYTLPTCLQAPPPAGHTHVYQPTHAPPTLQAPPTPHPPLQPRP